MSHEKTTRRTSDKTHGIAHAAALAALTAEQVLEAARARGVPAFAGAVGNRMPLLASLGLDLTAPGIRAALLRRARHEDPADRHDLEPSNGPRPRPRGTRRRSHRRDLLDAIEILCRSDRRVSVALVTILRCGDAQRLRAVRVILGLALRAARRTDRQVTIYVTTEPRRSR